MFQKNLMPLSSSPVIGQQVSVKCLELLLEKALSHLRKQQSSGRIPQSYNGNTFHYVPNNSSCQRHTITQEACIHYEFIVLFFPAVQFTLFRSNLKVPTSPFKQQIHILKIFFFSYNGILILK